MQWIEAKRVRRRGQARVRRCALVIARAGRRGSVKVAVTILLVSALFASVLASPAGAGSKTAKGAAIGAGVGLLAGGGKDAAKGALVGAGAGALTRGGEREKTKEYAKKSAAVGAGVGLLTGGVEGAAKGAVYGGAAGAIAGEQKDKKIQKKN